MSQASTPVPDSSISREDGVRAHSPPGFPVCPSWHLFRTLHSQCPQWSGQHQTSVPIPFTVFICLSGPADGDLPGQPHPVTDCPQRETCKPVKEPQEALVLVLVPTTGLKWRQRCLCVLSHSDSVDCLGLRINIAYLL